MLNKIFQISIYILVLLNIVVIYSHTLIRPINDFNNRNVSLTSDMELMMISEELFNKFSYELSNNVHINYQGQINFNNFSDNAPQRCLQRLLNISSNVFSISTIKSFVKLFDNYELDTYQPEVLTKTKDFEENEFIDDLMKTDIMSRVMYFLSIKGFFKNDIQVHKDILKQIWFHLYSRSKNINGSSGFEHVFVGERKPRKGIIGLHNWIFFSYGELSNKINYFGFSHWQKFINKVVILEIYFTYIGKRKRSTMFVGTIPELEIALYTLCFFTRPNKRCQLYFGGFKFYIQTYILQNKGTKFVGTAFPMLK